MRRGTAPHQMLGGHVGKRRFYAPYGPSASSAAMRSRCEAGLLDESKP